jgi:hypothetical protein
MKFTHQTQDVMLQGLIRAGASLEAKEEFPKKTGVEYKGIWLQLVGTEATRPKRLQHPAIIELVDEFNVIF